MTTLNLVRQRLNEALAQDTPNEVDLFAIKEALDAYEQSQATTPSPLIHWPAGMQEPAQIELTHAHDAYMFPEIQVTMPNGASARAALASINSEVPNVDFISQSGVWNEYLSTDGSSATWDDVDAALGATLVAAQRARLARDRSREPQRVLAALRQN